MTEGPTIPDVAATPRRRPWIVLLLLLWTIAGATLTAWFLSRDPGNRPLVDAGAAAFSPSRLHRSAYPLYTWLLLAPLVIWVCCRFPLRLSSARASILWLVGAALLFIGLGVFLQDQWSARDPVVTFFGDGSELAGQLETAFMKVIPEALGIDVIVNSGEHEFAFEDLQNLDEMEAVGLNGMLGHFFHGDAPFGMQVITSSVVETEFAEVFKMALGDETESTQIQVTRPRAASVRIETSETSTSGTLPVVTAAAQTLAHANSAAESRAPLEWAGMFGFHFLGFLLFAGLAHAGVYLRDAQSRRQRELALETDLATARLAHLQSQLQPHFLFNALNGISGQIRKSPDQAEEMIARLGDLLRLSLRHSKGATLIPLAREIDILECYLSLQRMRFGDRLRVTVAIDPDCRDVLLPPFLLQPLVENVIQHVLEHHTTPCHLEIRASRLPPDDTISLRILDDGADAPTFIFPKSGGTGTGLQNVRERLRTAFGDTASLHLNRHPILPTGTEVAIILPK